MEDSTRNIIKTIATPGSVIKFARKIDLEGRIEPQNTTNKIQYTMAKYTAKYLVYSTAAIIEISRLNIYYQTIKNIL
ncbi:MAG: hypothetical protein ACI83O_000246 [Patescibacteria group bacterium]|jgi:hypothetical protein